MENRPVTERRTNAFWTIWKRIIKNKMAMIGAFIIVFFILLAIFAPWIAPFNPAKQWLGEFGSLDEPTSEHWFGTDFFGRDILSRVIFGARVSLSIASLSVLIAVLVGVFLGSVAGYFGGFWDEIIMRFFDILLAFPDILLAIGIIAVLGAGQANIILAIAVYSTPQFARIARATVISIRENEFIEAARAVGERSWSILARYIIPNSIAPIIIQASLRMATAILSIAGLGFLGLGVKPPLAEWGTDLSLARTALQEAPHVGIFPGIAIFLIVMGFNFFGDGLNDALNPKLKDR